MHPHPRRELQRLLVAHGASLLTSTERCERLLLGACREFPQEVDLLVGTLELGIPRSLLFGRGGLPGANRIENMVRATAARLQVTPAEARWAVESWIVALRSAAYAPDTTSSGRVVKRPARKRRPLLGGMPLVLAAGLMAGFGGWCFGEIVFARPPAAAPALAAAKLEAKQPVPVAEVAPAFAVGVSGPHPAAGVRPSGVSLAAQVGRMAWDAEQDGLAGYVGVYLAMADQPRTPLAEYRGNEDFPSASTIKLPVLLAAQDAWKGARLPQGQDTGVMLAHMIQENDHDATNELVDELGGLEALNADLRRRLGQESAVTVMARKLQTVRGRPQNRACPQELAQLLAEISGRELQGDAAGREMLEWMRSADPEHRNRIPAGIPEPYRPRVASKTGTLANVVNDVALVECPDGRRYTLCIFMDQVRDRDAAEAFCRELSTLCWNALQSESGAGGAVSPGGPGAGEVR